MINDVPAGVTYKTHLIEYAKSKEDLRLGVESVLNKLSFERGFELVSVSIASTGKYTSAIDQYWNALITYKVSKPYAPPKELSTINNTIVLMGILHDGSTDLNADKASLILKYLRSDMYSIAADNDNNLYLHDDQYGDNHIFDRPCNIHELVCKCISIVHNMIGALQDDSEKEVCETLEHDMVCLKNIIY